MEQSAIAKKKVYAYHSKEADSQTRLVSANESSVDFSLAYNDFLNTYKKTKTPVAVNFRELVAFRSGVDRFTHLIHTYPAKLLLNIPHFFLRCRQIAKPNMLVLDPFCGSGTVLLESAVLGHRVAGSDANPLARLISRTKLLKLEKTVVEKTLSNILLRIQTSTAELYPQNILNWNYWFNKKTYHELAKLLAAIEVETDPAILDFLRTAFSQTVRKASLADPNISVPVKLNADRYEKSSEHYKETRNQIKKRKNTNVFELFQKTVRTNAARSATLPIVQSPIIMEDARNLLDLKDGSVDLIITSPPYAGAQKYVRASSLNLGWLNLCPNDRLRTLEAANIGREHYSKAEYTKLAFAPVKEASALLQKIYVKNPLRAHIAANYLVEMKASLQECYRVLKEDRCLVLITGNNVVCGYNFETNKYLAQICKNLGFKIELALTDDIESRGLMTKRNKTASIISCKSVMVLRK